MSLDALVWMIVGLGLGVGLSMLLLMLYSTIERARLRRRFRRARTLRAEPLAPEVQREPVAEPVRAEAGIRERVRPASPVVARPRLAAAPVQEDRPTPLPDVEPADAPEVAPPVAEPVADVPTPPADAMAMNEVEGTGRKPERVQPPVPSVGEIPAPDEVVQPEPEPEPAAARPEPKSVEALFAEAFAREPLVRRDDGADKA